MDWRERAARQHGVVTRAQVGTDGVTRHAVEHLAARGELTPRTRGVWTVAGAP